MVHPLRGSMLHLGIKQGNQAGFTTLPFSLYDQLKTMGISLPFLSDGLYEGTPP